MKVEAYPAKDDLSRYGVPVPPGNGRILRARSSIWLDRVAVPRLLVLVAAPLALVAGACASDDTGPAVTQTTPAATTALATEGGVIDERGEPVPAVEAPDQEAYRQSVLERRIVQETCTYEAAEALADCGERGTYALEPPPASAEASCVVGLAGGNQPEFVLCSDPNGGESKFYDLE